MCHSFCPILQGPEECDELLSFRCRQVQAEFVTLDRPALGPRLPPTARHVCARSGTKGLKILSYAPEEMISFQWNAPPEYPDVRNGGTWVVVQMRQEGTDRTRVTVTHLGWKEGPEWDRAYDHFVRGWDDLMKRLERRFTDGPIDWSKERMMYQDSKERKP